MNARRAAHRTARKRELHPLNTIIADLHTHTLASDHAFNTITEMVTQAAKLGLFAIACTDHGPQMPDAPHPWHFYSLSQLPRRPDGVWLLRGIEENVHDCAGRLDFSQERLAQFGFDWVVASIHPECIEEKLDVAAATRLWSHVAENPFVDMIGHSEQPEYAYDYDAVTKLFTEHRKVVELNANSFAVRPGGGENMRRLALACCKNGTKIAVNSDAHSIYQLGQCDAVLHLLDEIGFPPELIVNASPQNLIAELAAHGKAVAQEMEEALV